MGKQGKVQFSWRVDLRVGKRVEIKSADEILATLDENGCLEGLPFMPEMLRYCGKEFVVFKRIDKIIDVVNKTGLRRMSKTVTLQNVRCDGKAHGACQQECQLLWKDDWLRSSSRFDAEIARPSLRTGKTDEVGCESGSRLKTMLLRAAERFPGEPPGQEIYRCQATELFNASSYLAWWDIRQYLSPLWSGNITLKEFF